MEVSTEAPTHTIEREVMVIDPDGDLTVRTTDKDFRVCSSAMRRASPAMKAMLFGPWKEANRGPGPWIIDLPDDSSVAFEVILPIIHGASYTDYDLCKIEVHHIAHVVPVVQKYLMTPQLGPLINQWIMARQKHGWGLDHEDTLDDEYLDNLESAWNLGLTGAVSWCLAHLLYDGNTEDLDLLASARFFQERPHLLESIRAERCRLIEKHMKLFYMEYFKPCQATNPSPDVVEEMDQRRECYDAKIAAFKSMFRA